MDIKEFKQHIKEGAVILDTRTADKFSKGFIPCSVNIGLDGGYAIWVGVLLKFNTPLVLVTAEGKEEESITRLARIGYDNVIGYLQGGIEAWKKEKLTLDTINQLQSDELEDYIKTGEYTLVDVRNKIEINLNGKLKNSLSVPLNELQATLSKFNRDESYIVYCAGGYRSMMAASILKQAGIKHVYSISGGISKIKQEVPVLVEQG